MIKDLTQNELILLAYNEMPPDKHNKLMEQVENNPALFERFKELKAQQAELDTLWVKPHPTSVKIVLEESCSSSPLEMI